MQNKKGFTLVELVIVIAVIAILAGVMIGTFAGVINRANESAKLQEVKAQIDAAWVEFVADYHEIPTWVEVSNQGVVSFYNDDYTFTTETTVSGYTVATNATGYKIGSTTLNISIVAGSNAKKVVFTFDGNGYEVKLVDTTTANAYPAPTGKKLQKTV